MVDGATLDLIVTLGFGLTLRERCRLVDVNAAAATRRKVNREPNPGLSAIIREAIVSFLGGIEA